MLSRDFREFVELLNSGGVEYLVVGGYALAAHGHPRYTGDLDVWLRPMPANIARVLQVLDRFGFGSLGLKAADFEAPQAVVQVGHLPGRIDLLTAIDGVTFDDCYPRRMTIEVAGVQLPLIGLEDFKANKRATGRNRDLSDLDSLDEGGE